MTSPACKRAASMSPSLPGVTVGPAGSIVPSLGTRFSLSGYTGTVRYVGGVDETHGTWLGVEWDDQGRGKHDGIKDGKRYFSCL